MRPPPSSRRRRDSYVLCLLLMSLSVADGEFTTKGKGLKYVAIDTITAVASTKNALVVLGDVKKDPTPLLVADKAWEMTPTSRLDNGYPNIMYDPEYSAEKPWRLWYDCCVQVGIPNKCSPGKDLVG